MNISVLNTYVNWKCLFSKPMALHLLKMVMCVCWNCDKLIIWLYTNLHYGHTYFTSPVNSFLFKTHCRFITWENVCSLYIWWYKYPARIIITFQTFKQFYINVNTLNIYLLFIWGKVCLRRNRVQYVYMYILVCQPFVCIVDGNIKVLFNQTLHMTI